jgi:two-component system OmpR family response regulator
MKILLVEDEEKLARLLARGLVEEGHVVDVVGDGQLAIEQGRTVAYDAIVLDWMLPGLDGLSVLRAFRSSGMMRPVLMLTARDTPEERVLALRAGADDHLGKPFSYDELLARLEALHRRVGGVRSDRSIGDLVLDERRRSVVVGTHETALTPREWALLSRLASQPGEVMTRSQLLSAVWGQDFDGAPNVVDVYIGYVRGKLSASRRVRVQTVRGVGYRLLVDGNEA